MKRKILNLALLVMIISPILVLLLWCVTARWPWPALWPQHFSLRGWEDMTRQSDRLFKSILTSMSLSLTVALLSTTIALLSARALVLADPFLRRLIRVSLALPFIVPVMIFATGIHQKMIEWGLANKLSGIILVHLVYSLPYCAYLIFDAYQAVGIRHEEQAWLLGAKPYQAFIKVTLPLLSPVLFTALSMAYIVSFSQYFLTLMIGGGQVQTLTIWIFPYLQSNDRTLASNYALLFLGITLIVVGAFNGINYLLKRRYQATDFY